MTRAEEEALVLGLACLVEDRTKAEQKAMKAMAVRLDKEFNKNVVTNRAMYGDHAGTIKAVPLKPLSNLTAEVDETWRPSA